jgi:hypothetical protein
MSYVFMVRKNAKITEVARFSNGEWSGDEKIINRVQSELKSRDVDISTEKGLNRMETLFSGSHFWVAKVEE